MKGVQRKCLIASAVTHGLLLVMMFVASAFIPRKAPEEALSFTLVSFPDFIIDEPNLIGGGNPQAGVPNPEPAQPPPSTPSQPHPQPEKTIEPAPPVPVKTPEPEPNKFNIAEAITHKAPPKPVSLAKPETKFDFSKAKRGKIEPLANSKSASTQESTDPSARDTQIASVFGASSSHLKQGLSKGIGDIGVPGPGGAAYASYNLVLRKIYEDAWIPPNVATDHEPIVEVEVTIGRDGTVLSARVTKKGNKRELDQSVQRTLDRVKKVPAFPSGSVDEKRIFKINFNLSTKLKIG